MKKFVLKHLLTIIGITVGTISGFLYWKYIGCASGTCAITSKPLNSSVYGAIMGGLIFSMFQKENNKKTI
ncbi:MAG TPA: DUF6132 family protein [Chitinophagaceae bacterium]|nr:DUF6132 family protein [Chitinophagaceae bacterium]